MRRRLAVMMFLQYAALGVWGVTLPTFLMASPIDGGLCFSGQQVGLLFATFAIAAMGTPFFGGLIADRFIAGQRLLGLLHLLGAVLLFLLWSQAREGQRQACDDLIECTGENWREEIREYVNAVQISRPVEIGDVAVSWKLKVISLIRGKPFDRLDWLYPSRRYDRWLVHFMKERWSSTIEQIIAEDNFRSRTQPSSRRFFMLLLLYAFCYMPSLTLTNAIAFRNLAQTDTHYGQVRVFGTLGWMAAGIFVGFALPLISSTPLLLGIGLSCLLGLYAFTLPHTPPAHTGKTLSELFGVPAIKMFAQRSFRVFVITSFATTLMLAFHNTYLNRYLVDLGVEHAAAWQTVAQITEIVCILMLPRMLARFGLKATLLIGLTASALRFAIYAYGSIPWLIGVGIPLQGLCFGLYFVAAMLFIDKHAPRDLRASAQGLLAICTSGAGAFIGNWAAGLAVDGNRSPTGVAWSAVWALPTIGSLLAATFFGWRFKEPVAISSINQEDDLEAALLAPTSSAGR